MSEGETKVAQVAQQGTTAVGNTKSTARARNWCYTLNNPTTEEIAQVCKIQCKRHVCQLEEGEAKTPHLQGVVGFENAKSFTTMKKWLGTRAHIERCRNIKASMIYCSKKEGRIRTILTIGLPKKPTIIRNLRPWQLHLRNKILKKPDNREIVWVWDEKGNIGKTAFCKYMVIEHDAVYINGKASDMKYFLAQYFEKNPEKKGEGLICLMNFTRSIENYISYQGIEEIKDGIWFTTKYKCDTVVHNPPHIVCFANFPPDQSKLSKDRWCIYRL